MEKNLKIGDKVILNGYEMAYIGWQLQVLI
jgi:hypothetical protein